MIDVLLASYNGEKYIREQLDSILAQSYKNFRILISDDLSSDATLSIIREYARLHPDKVFILNNKSKRGCLGNFFYLLSQSRSDYSIFADQDDVWLDDKLKISLRRMKRMESRHGKDMPILVHSGMRVCDDELNILAEDYLSMLSVSARRKRLRELLVENNITGNSMLINKALRLRHRASKYAYMHDWWIGLEVAAFGKISYIDRALSLYRQHGENVVGAKKNLSLHQLKNSIANRSGVRQHYELMLRQAASFYKMFKYELRLEDRISLYNFIRLKEAGRLNKIYIILKYRFFKTSILLNIGQMLNI